MLVDTVKQLGDSISGKKLGGYKLGLQGTFIVERDGPNLQFNGEIIPYKGKGPKPFGRETHALEGWELVYNAAMQQAIALLGGKHKLIPTGNEASFVIEATGSPEEIIREIEAVGGVLSPPAQEYYHFENWPNSSH